MRERVALMLHEGRRVGNFWISWLIVFGEVRFFTIGAFDGRTWLALGHCRQRW